ncbi:MAG: DUF3048 domain-containing protein [Clostridia bacterium]|nr:DUF3048 domain-containing protein [Clostridia bacterium]
MSKRIIALILSLLLVVFCFAGCKKKAKTVESEPSKTVESEEKNPNKVNPYTGVQDLAPELFEKRPVAVMINNITTAQPVQTGVNRADIVYETEVEGGVTRLLALFKDIEKVDRLGPVRSARYPYIDLALGHDAVYIHCGQDPNYAAPHLYDIDDISVETDYYATRIPNGLAWEHTLYTNGSTLWGGVNDKTDRNTTEKTDPWQSFAAEDENISYSGTVANTVTIPFNDPASFVYDSAKGLYTRYTHGEVRTDYVTGETTDVKNVFVLNTTIVTYPDGVHRQVYLDGGTGYYATNGTYTQINWRKGGQNEGIVFTDANGNPLKINQGKSWVYLINSTTTNPSFS